MRRMKRARSSRSSRLRPADGSSSSSSAGSQRERAREADDLLDAERQAADRRVAVALQLDEIDDLLHRLAVPHLLAAHAGQKQHLGERIGADAGVAAGQQVLQHRHLRKQLAVLERAREAEPRDRRAAPAPVISCAAKADRAVAAVDAADAVEHAGLAGAVRADQREQLAGVDRERHAVEHDEAAEAQRQVLDLRAQPYHLRLRRYCLTSR